MSWFLRSNKNKNSRGSRRSRQTVKSHGSLTAKWDPQRTLLLTKVAGVVALVAALAGGWWYGEAALRNYMAQAHQYTVSPQMVVLEDTPAWMAEPVQYEIRKTVAARLTGDPLDGESLQHAAAALAYQPWVQQVQQLRRLGDGRVLVQASYRQPQAKVETSQGRYIVDGQGVLMFGRNHEKWLGSIDLPVIVGVQTSSPALLGNVWPGEPIQAGLVMIRTLARQPFADQITAYDVDSQDVQGRVSVTLQTAQGRVVWGLVPGRDDLLEPGAATKIQNIWDVARAYGGAIDAGGQTVLVNTPVIEIRRPGMSAYRVTLQDAGR